MNFFEYYKLWHKITRNHRELIDNSQQASEQKENFCAKLELSN